MAILHPKPENRQLLEIKAKKSLGQNFLIDKSVLADIVSAINPSKGDTIVEIGPGRGELTQPLLASGASVIAIEKDGQLARELNFKFEILNFKLIHGDALKELPVLDYSLKTTNYKLCGNIPYYITGHLFRIIGEMKHKPSLIVFMIQKEVAERICAKPKGMNPVRDKGSMRALGVSNGMNLLAASIQVWAKPEIVRFVSRESFNPRPKVDSAIIRLIPVRGQLSKVTSQNFYKLIKVLFKQPRKTILNNLKAGLENLKVKDASRLEKLLKESNINPSDRPQDLSIKKLISLSLLII